MPAEHWTVLTMSPDGAWGTATDITSSRAIAAAIARCKAMSGAPIGCGAKLVSIRAGWSLGFRCGSENIIVADKTLADAEHAARRREAELRHGYVPNMPACARLVTVDPHGAIVSPTASAQLGGPVQSRSVALVAAPHIADLPVWKTVTIGIWRNANSYRDALDVAGMKIGDSADEIIGRPAFRYEQTERSIELVRVSLNDLGLAQGVSLAEVYRRAAQAGLELCPPELAIALRLSYRDQPLGEFLNVAMEPVATYRRALTTLTLGNAGTGLLLIGGDGRPDFKVHGSWRFVFALPRPDQQSAQALSSQIR
jgi:hypothetical protein